MALQNVNSKEKQPNCSSISDFQNAENLAKRRSSRYFGESPLTPSGENCPRAVNNITGIQQPSKCSASKHSNDVNTAQVMTSLASRKSARTNNIREASPSPLTSRVGRRFTRVNDVTGSGTKAERKPGAGKPRAEKNATRRERKATKTLAIVLGESLAHSVDGAR